MKLKHWIRFLVHRDTTWHGQFPALAPLLLPCQGDSRTVVDVGANDGFYSSNSYPFIARGWRALLIEPHPEAFRRASRLHHRRTQVSLVNAACSDQEGQMELMASAEDDGGSHSSLAPSSGARSPAHPRGQTLPVKVHRLDSLLENFQVSPGFGLLTVDTEGHDFPVLRGANLEHYRPRVIITEKNPDDGDKFAFLQAQGYRLQRELEYDTIWARTSA